ncbi:MAG: hypothetical protein J3Q66DRAFT_107348 [Benniella sp.]|nr:MAG: hypothetical protein J3Q66DRAFT_107348 [Benniella sp.]
MSTGLSSWSSRNPKEEPHSPPALAPTSIPDLISEEAGHDLEDGDADVIRLAQHRPYMQQLQNSVGELHVSSNYTTTSTSFETFSTTTLERPAGRRMIMAGVVIPSRKRPSSERSLDDMDVVEPSPSSASDIRNTSTQTASVPAHSTSARKTRKLRKAFTEHQKDAMERAFSKNKQPTQEFRAQLATDIGEAVERVSAWFANRRKKERDRRTFINDEGSGGSGSGHSSPSTSPVPSPPLPPVQEMPEDAESEDESR